MKVYQQIILFDFIEKRFDSLTGAVYHLEREESCLGYPVYSGLLVCPICRQIWAELYIKDSEIFQPRMVSCTQCNWKGRPGSEWLNPVPGSLIDNPTVGGIDWPMLDALPPDLLKREFLLTLSAAERCPEAFEMEVQNVSAEG